MWSVNATHCCQNYQINLLTVRLSWVLLSGFAVLGALSGRADDVVPSHFTFDRYARMLDHSPFAVATAVALPEATPDFAKCLYVVNAAHSSEGDIATIMSSSDQKLKKYLTTKEPVDGYSIVSIEWSQEARETKVTISKDGKLATLTFNPTLLSQSASASARMAQNVPLIQRNPKTVPRFMPTPLSAEDLAWKSPKL